MTRKIFVFGSNLAGRHGAGAAKAARLMHGAVYGNGIGRQGNSYAIPTKDGRGGVDLKDPKQRLSLAAIQFHVGNFLQYARQHPELQFEVTPIGCGLSGYMPQDIAPMFRGAPANVSLPPCFKELL